MACTRRDLMKLGGLGTLEAVLARMLSPAAGSPAPPSPPVLLDQRYLAHGLDLLCTAHATDAFHTGHAGGAIVSAYYLCREEQLEAGTEAVIKSALDDHYGPPPEPPAAEEPAKDGVAKLLQAIEPGIDHLRRDGHDVIFLALALKAMHDLPNAATAVRLTGLRRTLDALQPRRAGKGDITIPESTAGFAEFVLEEFLASTEGGPGQGYAGHLLTHGRAILDLRLLGHEAFAQKCLNAFQVAVAQARPRKPRRAYTEERRKVEFRRPDGKEYWVRRTAEGDIELGHLFKYPYGFFGLLRHGKNVALNDVCVHNSYRLFRS